MGLPLCSTTFLSDDARAALRISKRPGRTRRPPRRRILLSPLRVRARVRVRVRVRVRARARARRSHTES